MPKGYFIGRVTVHDPEAYKAYAAAASVAMKIYGATILARGGRMEALEGEARARNVVLEFPSFDVARQWYHSPEYQAAIKLRQPISEGEFVIVEGYEPA